MSKRKLGNWIDAWMDYTHPLPSPVLWRRWSGIFNIAASMERRIYCKTSIGALYPNLYVIFVGPPGIGKTLMTAQVQYFLRGLVDPADKNSFHLASSSVTHASVVDELREAERRFIPPNMEIMRYNALTLVSNELGVLLPEYDSTMMSKLTDIYDGHSYSERRRTQNLNFAIDNPQLNLLAATTPSFLVATLPEGAWDQGFLSRTLLAFSAETMTRDIFGETLLQDRIAADLIHDLKHIFTLFGRVTFTEEAIAALEAWNRSGRLPLPDHPKLLHYNTRRAAHLLKLCMIACVATGDELSVTLDHYHMALDWLIELESYMPEIFKAMNVGGDARAMEDCWYHVGLIYTKDGMKPVSESRIVAFLAERIPAQNVGRVLDVMIKTGIFTEEFTGAPGRYYVPAARKR